MISRVASIRKCLPRPQLLGAVNLDRISHRSIQEGVLRMALSSSSVGGDPTVKAADNHPNRESLERSATPLSEKESSKSFLQRIWDRYSIAQQTSRILAAESYLQAATRQASDPRWFGPGRIGRDFRSYQALLTMHVWFIHKRLISNDSDPHVAAMVQQELFDIFWTDTTCRMRAHGVNEWLVSKSLKTVQQYSFMHCFHYDHCYTSPELLDHPDARLEELKHLVQTHIFQLDDPDKDAKKDSKAPKRRQRLGHEEDISERIAWYIETQYQNVVLDLPEDHFQNGRIAWVDLPDFDKTRDDRGNLLDDVPVNPEDVLPEDWTRNIANDGSYYFWNTRTRESSWERPPLRSDT